MAKAIYFNIPATGHVNPSLPVVRDLVQRGEEIIYVNWEALRDKIEHTGARFVPYPNLPEVVEWFKYVNPTNLMHNAQVLISIADRLLPFCIDLIEQEQPDFIIFDSLASWGRMAAQRFDLPTMAMTTTFVFELNNLPPFPLKTQVKTVVQALGVLPPYLLHSAKIRWRHHVQPVALPEAISCYGDINLVFTARRFQPRGDFVDERFFFVGPALEVRHYESSDFPFDQLRDDVPKIYISLGTLVNDNVTFFKEAMSVFGKYPAQFIMSVGTQIDISQLMPIPENFIVRKFVPQLDILEQVDVFITHGGMNSVHESLIYGVPMVVVPQQLEQALVARQVHDNGAGLALRFAAPFDTVTGVELRSALSIVLQSSKYKRNAAKLGSSLRRAGGAIYAADIVQVFGRLAQKQLVINRLD